MSSEEHKDEPVQPTPGASSSSAEEEQLFQYLVQTLEQKGDRSGASFYSNHFEVRVQEAVVARMKTQGWYCRATPKGSTLEWWCSTQSPADLEALGEELRRLRGTTYEDCKRPSKTAFIRCRRKGLGSYIQKRYNRPDCAGAADLRDCTN